jgi:cell division protein FtsB
LRARLVIGACLVVWAAYFTFFGGDYGMFELRRVREQRALEEERADAVRAEVERLRAWRDSLRTDSATIERVARERYGLIRNGERLYRFAASPADSVKAGVGSGSGSPERPRQ